MQEDRNPRAIVVRAFDGGRSLIMMGHDENFARRLTRQFADDIAERHRLAVVNDRPFIERTGPAKRSETVTQPRRGPATGRCATVPVGKARRKFLFESKGALAIKR